MLEEGFETSMVFVWLLASWSSRAPTSWGLLPPEIVVVEITVNNRIYDPQGYGYDFLL